MPFGDNVATYQARVSREDWRPHVQTIPSRKVRVPAAEPPPWWSEYLLDEWKRRNRYEQKPRDARTGWQKSEDEWRMQSWRWDANGPHAPESGKHDIWGTTDFQPEATAL